LEDSGSKLVDVIIPIKTYSEQNLTEHWSKKARRHKTQQKAVHIALLPYKHQLQDIFLKIQPGSKFVIVLNRIAPRKMDYDNMVYSFKWIVDQICENINPGLAKGRADDNSYISFQYDQKRGKVNQYAIQLQIFVI